MRRVLIVALALSACERLPTGPPDSYQDWKDQMIVRLGLPNVGIWPCRDHEEISSGEKVHVSMPVDECYKMERSRRWRGTWVLGPGEHDEQFCPGGTAVCALKSRPGYTLDWHRHPIGDVGWSKRYEVDFVGRRTSYPVDMFPAGEPYVIVVDRLNSMRDLGPLQRK
jgi:hypothetical protein